MTVDEKLRLDSTIYHYTRADTAIEYILPLARLKLSLLTETGDPLEYKVWFLGATGWGFPPDFDGKFSDTHRIINQIRLQEFRMTSFCLNQSPSLSEGDIRRLGCARSRMWSQYGDRHRGVCLAFDFDALVETIRQESGKEVFAGPIDYDLSHTIGARQLDIDAIKQMDLEEYCRQHVKRHHEKFFLKKDPDYDDEVEFRVLIWDPDRQLRYVGIKDSLIAVIIGDRFPDGLLPSIRHLCKVLRLGCRRVLWANGKPHLVCCAPSNHHLIKEWKDFKIPDPPDRDQ